LIRRELDATAVRRPVRIDVPLGATLELTVAVGGPETVMLGEIALEAADTASPAVFELLADTPGELPLRLLEAQRELGTVSVAR
jgi:hypothetical protein